MNSCQKKMLMLKNTGSSMFEEAYFVISEASQRSKTPESALIKEANRIVNESFISGYFDSARKKHALNSFTARFFLSGFFCGLAVCLLFFLYFSYSR